MFAETTALHGRVVELKYDGGGLLACQHGGVSKTITFSSKEASMAKSSSAPLRINQQVLFDVYSDGTSAQGIKLSPVGSESKGLTMVQHATRPKAQERSDTKSTEASTHDVKSTKAIRTQVCHGSRCVLDDRRISLKALRRQQNLRLVKLSSLTGSQRDAHVQAAKAAATAAMCSGDGDTLVRSVVDVVALLAPPWKVKVFKRSGHSMPDDAILRLQVAQQQSLRQVLLQLLTALDFHDGGPLKALQCPFLRIRHLLRNVNFSLIQSKSQWTRLAQFVETPTTNFKVPTISGNGDDTGGKARGPDDARTAAYGLRGCNDDGVWQPYARIQSLTNVHHRPSKAIMLRCTRCSLQISSACFFTHPLTKKISVLTPHNGHSLCQHAPFEAIGGSPIMRDASNVVDFCCHGKKRGRCAQCGGEELCAHAKQAFQCKICEPRNKRRRLGRLMNTPEYLQRG